MTNERPQRPVSTETKQLIAANLDADAEWADSHGYPEGAENLRGQATRHRERNGLPANGQQQTT